MAIAVLVYAVSRVESAQSIWEHLGRFDPRWGVLAFGANGLNLGLKALRFRYFLNARIRLRVMTRIVCMHSFWNNVLPYRSGELSYLYLLKQQSGITGGQSLVSLALARIFDVVALALMVVVALGMGWFKAAMPAPTVVQTLVVALAMTLLIMTLWLLTRHGNILATQIQHWVNTHTWFASGWPMHIAHKVTETLQALGALRKPSALFAFTVLSLAVWLSDAGLMWLALKAGHVSLFWWQTLWVSLFPVLSALIPMQGLAGVGTFEGTLTAGLALLGVPAASALGASLLVHLQLLSFSAILGGMAYAWHLRARRHP